MVTAPRGSLSRGGFSPFSPGTQVLERALQTSNTISVGWESKQLENAARFCKLQHSPHQKRACPCPSSAARAGGTPLFLPCPSSVTHPCSMSGARDAGVQVPYKQARSPRDPGASGSPHAQTSPQLHSPNQRGKRYGKLRQEKRLSLACTSIACPCTAAGSCTEQSPIAPRRGTSVGQKLSGDAAR